MINTYTHMPTQNLNSLESKGEIKEHSSQHVLLIPFSTFARWIRSCRPDTWSHNQSVDMVFSPLTGECGGTGPTSLFSLLSEMLVH